MWDVLIAGGGVAGASLAIELGRLGYRVRLLEKAAGPRNKVCGEGLMPAGASLLLSLGVSAQGCPFRGIRYWRGGRDITSEFPPKLGHGLGVLRIEFDAALLAAAEKHAEVVRGVKVDSVVVEGDRVVGVRAGGEILSAHLTVAADGVHSPLRQSAGIRARPASKRYALRAHFTSQWEPWVNVFWGDDHEVYVTPIGPQLVSVVLLSEVGRWKGAPQEALTAAINLHPELRRRLHGANQLDSAAGAAAWNISPRRRWLPGFLLHGDAGGYIDPITGGGMTQALLASRLFSQHARHGLPEDLAQFDRARARMLRGYHWLTRVALWVAERPVRAAASFRALRACPWIFRELVAVAGGAR